MAKHGGGYVILDLRDDPNVEGLVKMTQEQVDKVVEAYDKGLPILYVGCAAYGGALLEDVMVSAFTYAIKYDDDPYPYGISIPTSDGSGFVTGLINENNELYYFV